MNLKEAPVSINDIDKTSPVYEQPFLPIKEKYLTRIEMKLKDGSVYEFHEARWIHPDGTDMGMVDLSTETHMITKSRIAAIRMAMSKAEQLVGFVVKLTDGGARILTEGTVTIAR